MPPESGPNSLIPAGGDMVKTRFKTIPTGAGWTRLEEAAAVYAISQAASPATEIYVTFQEPADANAQTIYQTYTQGWAYVPTKGIAWIRHNAGADENFKIVDARNYVVGETPGPGGGSVVSANALYTPRVMAAPAVNSDVDTGSETLFAAAVGRRFIYVRNTSSSGQIVSLGIGAAAVNGSGIVLSPGEWVSFDALTGVTEQAFNVIADANNATVAFQLGT